MRVSWQWLNEYVNIPVGPEELAEKLTLTGLSVAGIHYIGKEIERVVTGKIQKIDAHPKADKLIICLVDTGQETLGQIVTGAPNVKEGQVVPVALEGARLAGGMVIKPAKFRGVVSQGMLCSGGELGLTTDIIPADQAHGILVFPPGTPSGQEVKTLLGLDDVILELEVTPNRGDCLSMLGVAREVAAIFKQPLRLQIPEVNPQPNEIKEYVQVEIKDVALCSRYVARLFKQVKVAPSPLWIQNRLRAGGVRPINNIVDLTNYVMLEMGQPLHAFDYACLKEGKIVVRKAKEGEELVSLDGVTRTLNPGMLVIADAKEPVALAGVMGGLNTEVTPETNTVLLEAACFHPQTIRRTSQILNLRSESSNRFEKGVDIEGCALSAHRAAQLIQHIQAGEVVAGIIDQYPKPFSPRTILLKTERVNFLLGVKIPAEEGEDILSRLNFQVQRQLDEPSGQSSYLIVKTPSYRPDIEREIDLVEEVARLYGYNQIPATLPFGTTTKGRRVGEQEIHAKIKEVLMSCGLNEVVTFSFINPAVFDLFDLSPESPYRNTIKLQNPLHKEQVALRTTLLPGLMEVIQRNFNRRVTNGAIFEIGRVFYPDSNGRIGFQTALPEERIMLAAAGTGKTLNGWHQPAIAIDFYYFKGVLETLLAVLGLTEISFVPFKREPGFHPGRTAQVMVNGNQMGLVGELHPNVLENYNLPVPVVAFSVDLTKLASLSGKNKTYTPLPHFPGINRDIAIMLPEGIPAEEVCGLIRKTGGNLLRNFCLFDVYQGEQIKKGYRSLAFTLNFQADDRTLTDNEVAVNVKTIAAALKEKLGAELR
ncbi:MAG: phenylalanine--tRNA ligase subunit beta [Peptococcaceae bacterium]